MIFKTGERWGNRTTFKKGVTVETVEGGNAVQRCAEFGREYQSSTDIGSIHGERLYRGTVGIDLHAFDGTIWLSSIRTFESGKGHASMAIDWLCSLADKHYVVIRGEPKPYNTALIDNIDLRSLDRFQLAAWYERHRLASSRGLDGSLQLWKNCRPTGRFTASSCRMVTCAPGC